MGMLLERGRLQSVQMIQSPHLIWIDVQALLQQHQNVSARLLYLPARDAVCAKDAHNGGDARIQEMAKLA